MPSIAPPGIPGIAGMVRRAAVIYRSDRADLRGGQLGGKPGASAADPPQVITLRGGRIP